MSPATNNPETQAASSRRMYNARAKIYDDSHHPQFALDLLGLVEVRPGERVLDLACGTGLGVVPAAKKVGPTGLVIGVDISDGMLAEAQRKVADAGYEGHVKLYNHSISDLSSLAEVNDKQGTFDLVMCCSALVLLQDPIAALRQWTAYLKPGKGKLAFDVTHPSTQPQGFLLELAAKSLGLPMHQNRVWATGEDALRDMITKAGGLKIEGTPFMPQHDWASRDFEGSEEEGRNEFHTLVKNEAFKHLTQGGTRTTQELESRFVELWCQEARSGDVIGTGGAGAVVELGGVNGAVCVRT